MSGEDSPFGSHAPSTEKRSSSHITEHAALMFTPRPNVAPNCALLVSPPAQTLHTRSSTALPRTIVSRRGSPTRNRRKNSLATTLPHPVRHIPLIQRRMHVMQRQFD